MLGNSQSSFGWISISIHWISAVAIIGLFILGWWMVDLTYYSPYYQTAPLWHTSIGILLAFVTVARLVWRKLNPSPEATGAAWEKISAVVAHVAMYLLLFGIFFSGYLIPTADGRGIEVFDWFVVPSMGELIEHQGTSSGDFHRWAAYVLMALVAVHALAALKHHFINKDTTLRRMLKPAKETNGDRK